MIMVVFLKRIFVAVGVAFLAGSVSFGQTAEVLPDDVQVQSVGDAATSGFGLGFEDLLSIVLTQLTFQDPLKPIDNFEFVSQLAQFSQIQQTETMTTTLESISQAGALSRASNLLGQTVDVPAGGALLTGRVTAVSFNDGSPRLTIETEDERTISNISITSISQVRLGG